jgi:hypothetical protein
MDRRTIGMEYSPVFSSRPVTKSSCSARQAAFVTPGAARGDSDRDERRPPYEAGRYAQSGEARSFTPLNEKRLFPL